jgi:hypothetical protein
MAGHPGLRIEVVGREARAMSTTAPVEPKAAGDEALGDRAGPDVAAASSLIRSPLN